MIRLFFAWLFLAVVLCWIYASANSHLLWLHVHWPPHRQRMAQAAFCLEASHHWKRDGYVAHQFRVKAYQLCEQCGCPSDLWPAGVLAIHVGVR